MAGYDDKVDYRGAITSESTRKVAESGEDEDSHKHEDKVDYREATTPKSTRKVAEG